MEAACTRAEQIYTSVIITADVLDFEDINEVNMIM